MFLEICAGVGLLVLLGVVGYKIWETEQPLTFDPDSCPANKFIEYQMGGRTHVLEIKSVKGVERNFVWAETMDGTIVFINSPEWRVIIKYGGDCCERKNRFSS